MHQACGPAKPSPSSSPWAISGKRSPSTRIIWSAIRTAILAISCVPTGNCRSGRTPPEHGFRMPAFAGVRISTRSKRKRHHRHAGKERVQLREDAIKGDPNEDRYHVMALADDGLWTDAIGEAEGEMRQRIDQHAAKENEACHIAIGKKMAD